jgi:hypothetical protein
MEYRPNTNTAIYEKAVYTKGRSHTKGRKEKGSKKMNMVDVLPA